MPVIEHDRTYYRQLPTDKLLDAARTHGLNPEMAVAVTERLANWANHGNYAGHFAFNPR